MPLTTKRLLAIGESMVEMAPLDGDCFQQKFAGDTLNTAWYARKCLPKNAEVSFLTGVGSDHLSDRMLSFIAESGVDVGDVARIPGRTVGLYLIELDNGERSFAYWRSHSAARCLADDAKLLEKAFAKASDIHFSGITVAILEPEKRKVLFQELSKARVNGVSIAFDPNIRPALWSDAKTMTDGLMQAAACADIVMPSFDEEALHFGDVDQQATIDRYRSVGVKVVAVKNGDQGMLGWAGGASVSLTPDPVANIVDSTAAGDSFNAGFLAALMQDQSLEQAMQNGSRLAAKVIQAKGALVAV